MTNKPTPTRTSFTPSFKYVQPKLYASFDHSSSPICDNQHPNNTAIILLTVYLLVITATKQNDKNKIPTNSGVLTASLICM